MTPDVNVYLLNFPNSGKEMVVKNEDDTYTILINARLSHDAQLRAYKHALSHIENNDFEKQDVQKIEAIAHEISKQADAKPIPSNRFELELKRLRRQQRKLREEMKKNEERVRFIAEYCDIYAILEHQHLYGNDL